jgi:hypothetical protein
MNVLHKNDVRDTACHEFSDCNPYFSSISSWLRHLYGVKHVEIPKENAKCVCVCKYRKSKSFHFFVEFSVTVVTVVRNEKIRRLGNEVYQKKNQVRRI